MHKPIFHFDLAQNSEEWNKIRAGKMTGSAFETFLVNGKGDGGLGAGAITQLYKIIQPRIIGELQPSFGSAATDSGHENEPYAIEAYEIAHFRKVKACGFIEKDEWTGSSPDGLMPEIEKGLEVKCFPVEHLRMIDNQSYKEENYVQCQFNLWCSGYKSWDLWYWHPKLPPLKFTFKPDLKMFEKFEERSKAAIKLAKEKIEKINNM